MNNLINRFIVCFIVISAVLCKENCDSLGILLYEDLGCIPEYEDSKKCPVSYTCQGIGRWGNKCHFRGEEYAYDEIVNNTLSAPSCDLACFCSAMEKGFVCAVLDCPEWLRHSAHTFGCYNKYSLDHCCSTGRICPNNKTPRCNFNGASYTEGQRIRPTDTCFDCVCQEGFNGKYEPPFCRRRSCGMQLKHPHYLKQICAPLYSPAFSSAKCCPDSWVCPTGGETIIGTPKSEKVCYFGNRSLKVGQSFEIGRVATYVKTVALVKCECVIPPLLTCTEHY